MESILASEGMSPDRMKFADAGALSHFEIGRSVRSGDARVGFSIEAAAKTFGLHFIPVRRERYDLIFFKDQIKRPQVKEFLSFINSAEFENLSAQLGGYDCRLTGKLIAA